MRIGPVTVTPRGGIRVGIASAASAIIAVGWYIGGKANADYERMNAQITANAAATQSLPNMAEDIKEIKTNVQKTKEDVSEIRGFVSGIQRSWAAPLVAPATQAQARGNP